MTWWCVASKAPWTWSWIAYPGVWLVVAAMAVPYALSVRRRGRSTGTPVPGRTKAAYAAGVALVWLASDWPIGSLGAGYLVSAHMVQYMMYAFMAAPLLLLGTPEWMARRVLGRLRAYRLSRWLARPLVAGVLFNVILVGTHAPATVDVLRTSQLGSFAMDVLWLWSGLLLWTPLVSPLPELRHPSYPVKMVYLFLAGGVIPMIPGGFLTFSSSPLYGLYELAPRVGGFAALDDQQLGGAIMKIGNIPIVWPVIFVMFTRWFAGDEHRSTPRPSRLPATAAPRPPAGPVGPAGPA